MSNSTVMTDAEVLREIDKALQSYQHNRALSKADKRERGLCCQVGKQIINGKAYYYETRSIDLTDPRN